MTSIADALKHYNSRYNNASYTKIQLTLVQNLSGHSYINNPELLDQTLRTEPIHTIVNLVTDACLEISGHPNYTGRHKQLIHALLDANVSTETMSSIREHMSHFESDNNTFSTDFENAVLILFSIRKLDIRSLAQLASTLHSTTGQATYELLHVANAALELGSILLKGEQSETYKLEKLQHLERYLTYAQHHLRINKSNSFIPYQTILLSSDETYPGIVTQQKENGDLSIRWYKWGYDNPEHLQSWVHANDINNLTVMTEQECRQRFGILPPSYLKN